MHLSRADAEFEEGHETFFSALLQLIKVRLKQTCNVPDRTFFLFLMVYAPAFEPASFEPISLYRQVIEENASSTAGTGSEEGHETFAPALH